MIYSLFGAIAGGIVLGYLCFDFSNQLAVTANFDTSN